MAPLSAVAARELLCSRVSGQVPAKAVERAIEVCGGNPLLLEQVALELRPEREAAGGTVSFSRFVGVGAAGRRYLQAASVLGTRFRVAVATEVAGLSTTGAATRSMDCSAVICSARPRTGGRGSPTR